jgi:hypothetical protein
LEKLRTTLTSTDLYWVFIRKIRRKSKRLERILFSDMVWTGRGDSLLLGNQLPQIFLKQTLYDAQGMTANVFVPRH